MVHFRAGALNTGTLTVGELPLALQSERMPKRIMHARRPTSHKIKFQNQTTSKCNVVNFSCSLNELNDSVGNLHVAFMSLVLGNIGQEFFAYSKFRA